MSKWALIPSNLLILKGEWQVEMANATKEMEMKEMGKMGKGEKNENGKNEKFEWKWKREK